MKAKSPVSPASTSKVLLDLAGCAWAAAPFAQPLNQSRESNPSSEDLREPKSLAPSSHILGSATLSAASGSSCEPPCMRLPQPVLLEAPMLALSISGLTKRFAANMVLQDICLEIEPTQIVALIGQNGAGKSTLLSCIVGTIIADAGKIEIAGHGLKTAPIRSRAALRYLPQEIELPAGLSGREILELHAAIFEAPLTASAIEFAALGEHLDHLATTYSVGMRRRLLLAAISLGKAALWVADEPFAGLDRPSQTTAITLLRARAAAGAGVLVAAHDPGEPWLAELGAKALFLRDGHLHSDDSSPLSTYKLRPAQSARQP